MYQRSCTVLCSSKGHGTQRAPPPAPGEGIMHPMFVKLFIETDADVCWPRKRPSGAARAGPGAIGRPPYL
jgi:hypothetical protein